MYWWFAALMLGAMGTGVGIGLLADPCGSRTRFRFGMNLLFLGLALFIIGAFGP